MPINYKVIERGNPSDPEAPKKFYPSIKSNGRMTLRQLATRITQISTVGAGDALNVLECMLTIIPEELAEGRIVELGDFGSFWLRTRSEGVDEEEKANANQLTTVQPRFNSGAEFRKALDHAKYVKIPQA
jgi:predicted histone-like DNA-binding protein